MLWNWENGVHLWLIWAVTFSSFFLLLLLAAHGIPFTGVPALAVCAQEKQKSARTLARVKQDYSGADSQAYTTNMVITNTQHRICGRLGVTKDS